MASGARVTGWILSPLCFVAGMIEFEVSYLRECFPVNTIHDTSTRMQHSHT